MYGIRQSDALSLVDQKKRIHAVRWGLEGTYFHRWSCSSHRTYSSGSLPQYVNTSVTVILLQAHSDHIIMYLLRHLEVHSRHCNVSNVKACQKGTRTEGAFRLVQLALPKGLISDSSVNCA